MPFDLLSGKYVAEKTNIWRDACDGHVDWLQEHIDAGAPLSSPDLCGDPPLILAAGNGHLAAVKLLVEDGADLEQRNVTKETPLIRAAHNGESESDGYFKPSGGAHENEVSFHIANLPRVCLFPVVTSFSLYPAHVYSPGLGHVETVRYLLSEGAEVDALDLGDNTALHWAAMRGHVEVVKALLAQGASRMLRNRQGKVPIDLAQPYWSMAYRYVRSVLAA